jgi:hypothetical protein
VCVDGDVLVLELKEFYTRYTNDVIATAAFGIGVDSFKQPTNEFYMSGQDLTYLGGLRAFKWLAYATMPKLMEVSAAVKTPWSTVLEKSVMEFPALDRTCRFVTTFTTAHHLYLF